MLRKPDSTNMIEISITLPEDVAKYLDEDPYIGDRSRFIAMLIRKWQRELDESKQEYEASLNDPHVIWD